MEQYHPASMLSSLRKGPGRPLHRGISIRPMSAQGLDEISTRKFDVGVFTQAGSKSEVGSLERHVRSTLNSRRRRTAYVRFVPSPIVGKCADFRGCALRHDFCRPELGYSPSKQRK